MSAERLREAARMLRSRVEKLTTDTERWNDAFTSGGVYGDHTTYERLFVHPGIGLALADWLSDESRYLEIKREVLGFEQSRHGSENAIRIADLILGDDQ